MYKIVYIVIFLWATTSSGNDGQQFKFRDLITKKVSEINKKLLVDSLVHKLKTSNFEDRESLGSDLSFFYSKINNYLYDMQPYFDDVLIQRNVNDRAGSIKRLIGKETYEKLVSICMDVIENESDVELLVTAYKLVGSVLYHKTATPKIQENYFRHSGRLQIESLLALSYLGVKESHPALRRLLMTSFEGKGFNEYLITGFSGEKIMSPLIIRALYYGKDFRIYKITQRYWTSDDINILLEILRVNIGSSDIVATTNSLIANKKLMNNSLLLSRVTEIIRAYSSSFRNNQMLEGLLKSKIYNGKMLDFNILRTLKYIIPEKDILLKVKESDLERVRSFYNDNIVSLKQKVVIKNEEK
ncbi:MAG: hypothetical protein NE334_01880 [Lentisphaeraceae bacterium]|nr:hypothetical protein [Lentisphaeraceae bacterium]